MSSINFHTKDGTKLTTRRRQRGDYTLEIHLTSNAITKKASKSLYKALCKALRDTALGAVVRMSKPTLRPQRKKLTYSQRVQQMNQARRRRINHGKNRI